MIIHKLTSSYSRDITTLYKNELDKKSLLGSVYLSPKVENYISYLSDSSLEDFFGIVDNERLVAVIQLKATSSFLHINNIVVDSMHQGKGYGLKLISYAISLAKELKLRLSLDVDSENKKAFNWYKSLDFIETKESHTLCFKLRGRLQNEQLSFLDDSNLKRFGFSEVNIQTPYNNDLNLFFVEPSTYKVKGDLIIDINLIQYLNEMIAGTLLVSANTINKDNFLLPYFSKSTYRLEKNEL